MKLIDAAGILDIAMSGSTATLLARRWESALLVNVDNATLRRLMGNAEAMDALTRNEGIRNLNQDIETIINKSEAVKKARKETPDEAMTPQKQREPPAPPPAVKNLSRPVWFRSVFRPSAWRTLRQNIPTATSTARRFPKIASKTAA